MKISKFSYYKMYYLILSVLLKIRAINMQNKKYVFNKLLSQPGWRNLNGVTEAKYWTATYTLLDILKGNINCDDTQIRGTTVYLGCSYAYVLQEVLYMINRFQNHCKENIIQNDFDQYAYNCIIEVKDTLLNIHWMATLMKGAMDTIEKFHSVPWWTHVKNYYFLSNVFADIQNSFNSQNINNLAPIQKNFHIEEKLKTIEKVLTRINKEVNTDIKQRCKLKSLNYESLWENWEDEFNKQKSTAIKKPFYHFLGNKIANLMQSTIQDKYFGLGFDCNKETNETFLPGHPTIFNQENTI
ncbi:uncharacterized protein LOC126901682 isoform X3 [Daktulosphaira vitifoliae]|uniref:uncharacterized protein LOC126901682 isoform X3 n=1 Tax=Daktulosphaira vitifoliae TaxID=58002 RepID=UPI0021AA8504|nr:uncharacterized protein LOC126901682 isoform X3 [Daktulosphaira vitifoliae]